MNTLNDKELKHYIHQLYLKINVEEANKNTVSYMITRRELLYDFTPKEREFILHETQKTLIEADNPNEHLIRLYETILRLENQPIL